MRFEMAVFAQCFLKFLRLLHCSEEKKLPVKR
uniref:Uncharacterized protein n=1 Tax=Arundo donax TaxID=35708 RepID=A0A0A9HMJ0_ARUDO